VNVIAFDAPFWRGGLWKQDLEHASGNTHDSLILAETDAELIAERSGFHRASGGNRKNIDLLGCSANVPTTSHRSKRRVEYLTCRSKIAVTKPR
jgi:hypothetical protein